MAMVSFCEPLISKQARFVPLNLIIKCLLKENHEGRDLFGSAGKNSENPIERKSSYMDSKLKAAGATIWKFGPKETIFMPLSDFCDSGEDEVVFHKVVIADYQSYNLCSIHN
ncbi:hypothetical protein C5167_043529 [Papaver somniferum]|uniref:Uncharacterized protein n=1 Tax=Papaver somniferum TaxID=3469 RepID=A0A4Y7L610_PAPSO|nr:hypothetical protein C5167_043529 [Papaver somniferum]